MKHIHILGIGGTFMSALAILAREAGYQVTGCDAQCYPPVSDLLVDKNITWTEGYDDIGLALSADEVIIGNTMKRGTPVLEAVLSEGKPFSSGPAWLAKHILSRYKVMAISGTHGKTTTTSMLAWILSEAGLNPGFLIGGVVPGFQTNAKLGIGEWFVIEADEYDSAFFDKRPKFMHYWPTVAVMNNLEFDHADIYADLAAIKKQFFYLLRTIPQDGMVIYPIDDENLTSLCQKQSFCYSQTVSSTSHADWEAKLIEPDGSHFDVYFQQSKVCEVKWSLIGQFNVDNALSAMVASQQAGVSPVEAAQALAVFEPVKRRLEVRGCIHDITVYDDFAHHPTAITKTIGALKAAKRHQRIIVVMEFASFSMRMGKHKDSLKQALAEADALWIRRPEHFDVTDCLPDLVESHVCDSVDDIYQAIMPTLKPGDGVLVMSNRGFEGIHQRILSHL